MTALQQTMLESRQTMAALQQTMLESNRNSRELDSKFEKLPEDAQDFHFWLATLRSRLQHEAWQNILADGEPYATKATNKTLSGKLCQRLYESMTVSTFEAAGIGDEFNGLGLELPQAIIQHFIPSETANLPIIFSEWAKTEQKQDELAVVFSGRVTRLAARSKRAGQEHTESSKILTFVEGLHDGFADFKTDCFSGRMCVSETSLRNTTSLAKTLELTMDRCHATPDHAADAGAGPPLNDTQVNRLFDDFDCPLCRTQDHSFLDCPAYDDQGFIIAEAEHDDQGSNTAGSRSRRTVC